MKSIVWTRRRLALVVGMGVAWLAGSGGRLGAETWPAWRGPAGNGSVARGDYPSKWGVEGVVWKAALPGKGGSTPVVWDGRILLTSPAEGQDAVLAYDLSGKRLWMTQLGAESAAKHRTLGSSCNASPVTDGEAVYAYFRSGRLAAVGFDGRVRWQENLTERFGRENLFWDAGASPVLVDDLVVVVRLHGGESWLAAFDKRSGELRWKVGRTYQAPTENDNGYTTPLVVSHRGGKALVVWAADRLTAHAVADGKLLWSCEGFNPEGTGFWPAIASPVVSGDMVVVPVGRDDRPGQARVHGIRLGGEGDVTGTHRVWKREDLGVFVPALAEHAGRVYLLRHRGEVVCLDPKTGATVWSGALPRERAPYYASPLVANGILYAAREDGVVFAARVGEAFEVLSENPMGERIVASPVPAAGRLLLRGDAHLFCVAGK